MKSKFISVLLLGLMLPLSLPFAAAQRLSVTSDSLHHPEITCGSTSCSIIPETTLASARSVPAAVADPNPVVVAPPAGQRMLFQGAGYPSCWSILGSGLNNLSEYIKAESIDVPLGSTHVSLSVAVEARLRGHGGITSSFGRLQVRPNGGDWQNVSTGYAATSTGTLEETDQFTQASYIALVDLAMLQGANGEVPSTIDVRMAFFENRIGAYVAQKNDICKGQLILTF